MAGAPVEALRPVPLFADLTGEELAQVAVLFKERHFAAGETVVKEGADGAARLRERRDRMEAAPVALPQAPLGRADLSSPRTQNS